MSQTFHLASHKGWSNDLQTIVWNQEKNYYDIYFLHSVDGATDPFGPSGQDWIHTTTKDFITYSKQETAIPAKGGDSKEGWHSAWTGSVVTDSQGISGIQNEEPVAYFTGLMDDGSQAIYASASNDKGTSFTKALKDGKPLLTKEQSYNGKDFRDPYVFHFKDKLLMYVAEGDALGVYQSQDGINWTKADSKGDSKILPETFFKGRNWQDNAPIECPVLKTMTTTDGRDKQVLFFGAKDTASGETTGTYYTVGHLDGNGLFIADTETKRLDQGSDYYGSNFTGSDRIEESNHNLISLGWVGNWNYFTSGIHSDQEAKSDFLKTIGFYTTPRQLQLDKNNIIQSAPLYKNEQLTLKNQNGNISSQRPLTSDNRKPWIDKSHNQNANGLLDLAGKNSSGYYQLHFSNIKKEGGYIYIDIWQGSDYVKIAYQITSGTYQVSAYAAELNNSMDGSQTASSYYYDGLLGNGQGYKADSHYKETDNITITLITDNRSLEIFFPNGQTYTLARFNTSGRQDVKVFSTQKDLLLNLKIYDVHS
ncbi:glycoside hydrolase family 32 protein [Streptococcus sp. SV2]|uniref:glycoside hydrolase family 32 protein n=1 Tax=unclassified Streptococcus TaxID=2608887 RepID=UPI00263E25F6|nr:MULTISPECIES: glycoside hydrolase family 32 protein [unclassified Streptococcus]MDN5030078.1 glycoside hydrolase family 32 protein [Streptococcus sp. SV1]MDN5040067.1 glycoside hydrolase family 32 protein [Streptococcus sp. SV2]